MEVKLYLVTAQVSPYMHSSSQSFEQSGVDLGFSEGGANPSSVSLKQEVWGHSPQKL